MDGCVTVVGIIPAHILKKAIKAGRKKDDMGGCARRRFAILQLSYGKLLDNWNANIAKTKYFKILQWVNGLWRLCKTVFSAFLGDQPELHSICCGTSPSCKQCNCLWAHLHLLDRHRPKYAVHIMQRAYHAYHALTSIYSTRYAAVQHKTAHDE